MQELQQKERIPPSAVNQLQRLCQLLSQSLPELKGVILHGSAASDGFEADRSDLDLLVIVGTDLDPQQCTQLAKGLLDISNAPHPLEISILSQEALNNWQHPCPYLFHFGEEYRERFDVGQYEPESSTDDDLAMHLVVARARGIELTGSFPVSELPQVPRSDYLAAILCDFEWAQQQAEDMSDYLFSNACRTLAYLREGLILSKSEGRRWCADRDINPVTLVADVTSELSQYGRRS